MSLIIATNFVVHTCAKFFVHVCLQSCLLGAEKCLLYSMRMWGDSVGELLVASGTILNEVSFPGSQAVSASVLV